MVISPVHFPSYRFWPRNKRGDAFSHPAFYFQMGSWALAYGIMAMAKRSGKEKVCVWFPDYFCREPLAVLKRFPIDVGYYPVQKNLTPDFEALSGMVEFGAPDALVLVHYFGFSNDLAGAKVFCEKHGIDLIEDCAHVMMPYGNVGTSGTMSFWSPWKFFPVPELGVLWIRDDLKQFLEVPDPQYEAWSLAKWLAKREVQRLLCGVGVNWYQRFHSSPSPPLTDAFPNSLSMRLFHTYLRNTDHIRARRIENYSVLESLFKARYPEALVMTRSGDAVPYAFPCLTQKPANEISKELIARGIPAFPWPALPDEVVDNSKMHKTAQWLAGHILLLPIHQNISLRQMEYITQQLSTIW